MANRYSIASGNTNDPAMWDGGASVPGEGDRVLVMTGHDVVVKGAVTWGDDATSTITINGVSTANSITINGKLSFDRTADSSLTCKGNLFAATGTIDMGTEASPIPSGVTAKIFLNKSGTLAAGKYGMRVEGAGKFTAWGATKKRIAVLSANAAVGATSVTVADATGWNVGDELYFCQGSTTASNQWEARTIAAGYTPGSTTVPLSSALSYAHASGHPVANLTSNVVVTAYNTTYRGYVIFSTRTTTTKDSCEMGFCTFDSIYEVYPYYGVNFAQEANYGSTLFKQAWRRVESVAFVLRTATYALNTTLMQTETRLPIANSAIVGLANNADVYIDSGYASFTDCLFSDKMSLNSSLGSVFDGGWVVRTNTSGGFFSGNGRNYRFRNGVKLGSGSAAVYQGTAPGMIDTRFDNYDFTQGYRAGYPLVDMQSCGTNVSTTFTDCLIPAIASVANQTNITDESFIKLVNINQDVTLQEEHYRFGSIVRDNAVTNRGTSSLRMKPSTADTAFSYARKISVTAGETVRMVGYCRYDSTYAGTGFVAPTLTLSGTVAGTVLTPVTFTAPSAAANTWHAIDISITNTSGAAGEIDMTFGIQAGNTTGLVYWDGMPVAPIVTAVRHYGFVFDESNPKRVVDPYTVASEATASAYTGVTIDNSTKKISFGAGTADTAQKFYDYSRAWCVADLTRQIPLTRAGSLFSLTSGWTVVDPAYTTTLTWGGGTVQFTSTGAKAVNIDAAIVEFNVATGGSFSLTGALTGTLDLRNLDDTAITVEVPTGTSYTTANNTGAVITVTTPQVYQSVTLSGVVAGSRVQIYDTTNSIELFNGTSGYSWTDSVPAAGNRAIRIRVAKVSGATAKEFIEANIGTCGTTEPGNAIAYLVSQSDDAVYNANAIDGSTVTGITFTDAATDVMNINIAAGAVNWKSIYAAWVWYAFDAVGITTDIDYIEAVDTANYVLSNLIIKNTSSPSVPLEITGGYGRDAVTGATIDLVDTTGGTLIFAPDHVVSYAVGSGVTAQDITDIAAASASSSAAAILAAAQTTPIHSDIRKVNAITVDGGGTDANPWGAA